MKLGILGLALAALWLPGGAAASELTITATAADESARVLDIVGRDFGRTAGKVWLNLQPLDVLAWSRSRITATLPENLAPGSYLLVVSRGKSGTEQDRFVVTLGALGPRGADGPKGDRGEAGPPGPAGAPPAPPGTGGIREYSAAGVVHDFVVPPGVTSLLVELWGAGGGGGGGAVAALEPGSAAGGGGGGGAGAYVKAVVAVVPERTYTVLLGVGGVGGGLGDRGADGDATVFTTSGSGPLAAAAGGAGGQAGTGNVTCATPAPEMLASGGAGGAGGGPRSSAGSLVRAGGDGKPGQPVQSHFLGVDPPTCSTVLGGAGGAGGVSVAGSVGPLGSNGAPGGRGQTRLNGSLGDTGDTTRGGNGASGYAIVTW